MRNIFGWLGQQEHRKALSEAKEHIDKVRDVVRRLQEAMHAFVQGDRDKVQALYQQVESEEQQADIIRRNLLSSLSEGLFLPPDREDLVRFVEHMDDIADYACASARLLILLDDAQVPEVLKESLLREVELLSRGVDKLREAILYLYRGDIKEALALCNEVEETEEEADRQKARLLRHIFKELGLEAPVLLLMHDLIEALENTADRTEDSADQIRLLAVKHRG